jgi:hypothetical protein
MEVTLAYEQGILRSPDLTRIQQWALFYYVKSQERAKRTVKSDELDYLAFFSNPDLWSEMNKKKEEAQAEESLDTVAPDFNELEELLRRMESGATLVADDIEELGDEEGWQ